ncbi:unnamed protein product, partial [Gulo gulo]
MLFKKSVPLPPATLGGRCTYSSALSRRGNQGLSNVQQAKSVAEADGDFRDRPFHYYTN